MAAIFVNGLGRNEQLYRGPPIDASYKYYSFRPDPLTNMATTGDSCF
jgi:hypothetical protein